MLNTWITEPWVKLACELVGLDSTDYPAMTHEDLRALIRGRAATLERNRYDEDASGCEQDMCGECTGCAERARVNFEHGEDHCCCCGGYEGEHIPDTGGGCVYVDVYTAEERAEHQATGYARLDDPRDDLKIVAVWAEQS